MNRQDESLLTSEEARKIILAMLVEGPVPQDDILKVLEWAQGVRADMGMLQCVLDGKVLVRWEDGDISLKLTDGAK